MQENALFNLVKSLSKGEKRFFKLLSKLQKGEKKYTVLLDLLDEMDGYNEEYLKKRISKKMGQPVSNQELSAIKHYLFKILLKSLRNSNEERLVKSRIKVLLEEADILEQRSLYPHYYKRLYKAKKLAEKYEYHLMLIDILNQLALFSLSKENKTGIDTNTIYEEIAEVQERLRLETSYRRIYHSVFIFFRTENNFRDEELVERINEIKNHPLLMNPANAKTFQSKLAYFFSQALIHHILKDRQKSNSYYHEIVNTWTLSDHFIKERSKEYKIHISNYLNSCHFIKNYAPFEEWINKIETLPISSEDEAAEQFHNVSFLRFLYFMNTRKYKDCLMLIKKIDAGINKYKAKLSKGREISFYYNISVFLFAMEQYELADTWVKKIINMHGVDHRRDVQFFAKIFQLIIYFELGNYQLIHNMIRNTYRSFKKVNKLYAFEKTMLSFLKRVVDFKVLKKEKESFIKLEKKLQELSNKPEFRPFLGYKEIMIWIESHIAEQKFIKVLEGNSV